MRMNSVIGPMCRKRLINEARLLKRNPHEYIDVTIDESDILTWYFLIKGPEFSDYKGGFYIGKIIYTPEYPQKPPDFTMLTPSGRFTVETKICLSNSSFHSEEWNPLWNMSATLTGFLSIMLDDSEHGISHIKTDKDEREKLAIESIEYNKIFYSHILKQFTRFVDENGDILKNKIDTIRDCNNVNNDDVNNDDANNNAENESNINNNNNAENESDINSNNNAENESDINNNDGANNNDNMGNVDNDGANNNDSMENYDNIQDTSVVKKPRKKTVKKSVKKIVKKTIKKKVEK